MRFSNNSWDTLLVASIVIVAGLCAQSQQAAHAEDDTQLEGKIVRISPDPVKVSEETVEDETAAGEAIYWIGISGRGVESAVLRTQLQLAADMGVVVEQVVSDSPADKAGLRRHDIILRANGKAVHGMTVLQEYVRKHQAKPLELKFLRLGKEETVVVVPEEQPQKLAKQGPRSRNDFGGHPDGMRNLLEQLQRQGGLRMAPRAPFPAPRRGFGTLPGGVSVSIQRENNGPAKITVKQGDKTWHVVEGDLESIDRLPEELRPYVQRMLQGNEAQGDDLGFDWEAELEGLLPRGFGGLQRRRDQQPAPAATPQEQEINQRMKRLEQELRELQKRLAEE